MNPKAPYILFVVLMSLVFAAGGVIIADARTQRGQRKSVDEFQQLVHGLGFGPAIDLLRCDFSFDPRLGRNCPEDLGPIPGGVHFCPHHACSILFYRQSIDRDSTSEAEAGRDAEAP